MLCILSTLACSSVVSSAEVAAYGFGSLWPVEVSFRAPHNLSSLCTPDLATSIALITPGRNACHSDVTIDGPQSYQAQCAETGKDIWAWERTTFTNASCNPTQLLRTEAMPIHTCTAANLGYEVRFCWASFEDDSEVFEDLRAFGIHLAVYATAQCRNDTLLGYRLQREQKCLTAWQGSEMWITSGQRRVEIRKWANSSNCSGHYIPDVSFHRDVNNVLVGCAPLEYDSAGDVLSWGKVIRATPITNAPLPLPPMSTHYWESSANRVEVLSGVLWLTFAMLM